MEKAIAAKAFAVTAHGSQRYGDQPYEAHLEAVAQVVSSVSRDDDLIAAAWLHDVIEDTDVTREDVAAVFGERVAAIVHAVSGEGSNRAERVAAIYRKAGAVEGAALVKTADRIANIEAAPVGSPHRARYDAERAGFRGRVSCLAPKALRLRLEAAY